MTWVTPNRYQQKKIYFVTGQMLEIVDLFSFRGPMIGQPTATCAQLFSLTVQEQPGGAIAIRPADNGVRRLDAAAFQRHHLMQMFPGVYWKIRRSLNKLTVAGLLTSDISKLLYKTGRGQLNRYYCLKGNESDDDSNIFQRHIILSFIFSRRTE